MKRRAPDHAGSAADQARIARRIMGRAESRQRDERLDAVDRDLLNILDRLHVLGYGDGRIGVRRLAEQVHRTARTVRRHLARLECLGYLQVIERLARHGGPAVNRYRVLTPRERGAAAWSRRRQARGARDAARKVRRGGGVLTPTAPPLTRGRVIAPSGTGDRDRQRPTVPVGQADKRREVDVPMRVDAWIAHEDAGGRWLSPALLGKEALYASPHPGRGPEAVKPSPVRVASPDPAQRSADVESARRRIAELAARGSAASGWRRG